MTDICTPRLRLRDRTAADFDAVWALVSQFEVIRWTASWPWPADPDYTRQRLATPVPAEDGRALLIEQACGPEAGVIGMIHLIRGHLGYTLAQTAWGRGIATEAAAALVDHMFAARPGLSQVEAGVFDGNAASCRVLEKLGFRQTGRGQILCRAQGRALSGPDFTLTRADREAARAFSAGPPQGN